MGDSLQDIIALLDSAQLQCLLIGGMAVNQYTVSRQTFDMDFVIRDSDKDKLFAAARHVGYDVLHRHENFIRFNAKREDGYIVDFLFLADETFDRMWKERRAVKMDGRAFDVASPLHLVRMKLHALRHGAAKRNEKDVPDIVRLLRFAGVTPETVSVREDCLKYGSLEIYDRVKSAWNSNQK